MSKNLHVFAYHDGWIVKTEGDKKYSSFHLSQEEAINAARKTAKKQKAEIIIHRRNESLGEIE